MIYNSQRLLHSVIRLLKSQSRVDQRVSVSMERSKGVVNTALEDRTNIGMMK